MKDLTRYLNENQIDEAYGLLGIEITACAMLAAASFEAIGAGVAQLYHIWNHPRKAMKELKNILGSSEYAQVVSMQYNPELNNWKEWADFIELVKEEAGFKKLRDQLELVWTSQVRCREYWDMLPHEVQEGIRQVIDSNL